MIDQVGTSPAIPHPRDPLKVSARDTTLIIILSIILFVAASTYDLFDKVYDPLDSLDSYRVDEIFLVLVMLPFLFTWYAGRRRQELEVEKERGLLKDEVIRLETHLNQAVLGSLSEGIIIFDGQGKITSFNRIAEHMVGIFQDQTDGGWYTRTGLEFFKADGSILPYDEWAVSRAFKDRMPIMGQQAGIKSPDNIMSWVIINAVPSINPQGHVDRLVATMTDVTDLLKAEEEKSRAMTTNAMIEALGDGLILLNMDGMITTVNKAFEVMTGYGRDELIGMYGANLISNLIKIGKEANAVEGIKKSIEKETRPYGAIILQTKNGVEIPTAITASYLRDEDDSPIAIITTFKNISNVLMLEDALWESNERFQRITAHANDAIFLVDDLGRISYWNPAAEKIFGYSKFEAEGKKLTHLILPQHLREDLQDRMSKPSLTDGEPFIRKTVESMAKRKDGEEFPIELSFSILIIKGSFHTIGIVRDISERKRAEIALYESEERQRALFNGSTDPIIITDLEDRVLKANPAVERVFGYRTDEIIGQEFPGHIGFDVGKFGEWVEACRNGTGVSDYETVRRNSAGEEIPVSISISPIFDTTGNLISLSFWYRDITVRKWNEERLMFQAHLLNSVRESVVATDLDGRITYWGRGAENLYKYSADEVLGQLITFIAEQHDEQRELTRIRETIETGSWSGEYVQRRRDGSKFWASTSMSLVDDITGQPAGIIGIDRDISELKQTGEALRDSEERYRAVTETVFTGIAIADQDGMLIYVNTAFSELTGHSKDELEGMSLFSVTDEEEFVNHRKTSLSEEGSRSTYESIAIRKDGSVLNVLIAVSPISTPEGLFSGTICAFVDITERKSTEKRIRSSLAEKEVLLKEVHHRVKNNLQVVSSLLYLQSEQLHEESAKSMLRESQNRVKSMALVHERLYQSEDLARINFADYIRNLGSHLFHSFGTDPRQVKMTLNVEDIHLSIEVAIPCGLIINELISNALKHAFPDEATGEIMVSLHQAEGGELTLSISDDGIGVPEGFSIENTDSMGLHLVHTLIRQLDAEITIDRTNGTKYQITFTELKEGP
jgi:PAS domain S-box-containing protein